MYIKSAVKVFYMNVHENLKNWRYFCLYYNIFVVLPDQVSSVHAIYTYTAAKHFYQFKLKYQLETAEYYSISAEIWGCLSNLLKSAGK